MQAAGGASLADVTSGTTGARHRSAVSILIATGVLTLVADAISKALVVAHLTDRSPIVLLGGIVRLTETRNPGAAFSMGTGITVVFTAVAVAVVVVIVRTARTLTSRAWAISLGLLLGGALGNLADRLLRSPGFMRGEVVDWIQVPHFAVFNLADSAITIGGALAVLLSVRGVAMATDGTARSADPVADEASDHA
jgi:signal peptidase II